MAGVTVARFAGERAPTRAVSDHFGTMLRLAGRSRWARGRDEWSIAPGDVGLKVPGEAVVETAREGAIAFQAVLFDHALVEEALEHRHGTPHFRAIDRRDPRAAPLFSLHRALLEGEPLEDVVCEAVGALVELAYSYERRWTFSAPVRRARELLDERFTETIGLEELAAHARLDKFRLCRAFREQIGLPPHAYATHRRIMLAQRLLASGMPQAEVAVRVGFYDQSLLHRHFKRIIALTPGAFARAALSRGACRLPR